MSIETFDLNQPVPPTGKISGGTQTLGFELHRLTNGRSNGVDRVTLTCGSKTVDVLPTRGMGIWQATNDRVEFGWDSPVAGPVHPMWVPADEPSGIGWLDGFDEMSVRCGLTSNGAPEFDENGRVRFPLHGRIANLPAHDVFVEIDESNGQIAISGTVYESRFHFSRLLLQTKILLQMDSDEISIIDRVTNESDRPGSFQMLYHNNFGAPILGQGSQLFAPVKKLVPRNAHAATGLKNWNRFSGPDAKFTEQVYFLELATNQHNESMVVLANADQSKAVSIRYDATHLPCFTVWKNTVGQSDGYVAGLEPGTNFPNTRTFEESNGRVVPLDPSESCELSFHIGMLVRPPQVNQAIEQVEALTPADVEIFDQPTTDWCEGE